MADQINVPIKSTYDDAGAKKALADAKAIDSAKPTVKVGADTKAAVKDIDGLMKKVSLLDKDAATLLLTSNATAIATDIAGLIVDLDKLDANDVTIEAKATQINDLKGDLDKVEAKIREVNNVPVDINTAPTTKGLKEVEKSADSSKSVLANMIGNTTQDLGALGGVAGSAGVAIGQLGEYMADAKSSGEGLGSILRNFAGVAGPIALIGLTTKLISDHFAKLSEDTKFNADQAKRFAASIADGADEAGVLRKELEETGDLKFKVQIEGPDIDVDAAGAIARAGLNLEEFAALGKLSKEGFDAWAEGAENAGVSEKDLATISLALAANFQQQGKATEIAANNTKLLGNSAEEAAERQREVDESLQSSAASTERYNQRAKEQADTIQRVNDILREQADALNEQVDAATSAADAQRDENKALQDYAEKLDDAKASTDDVVDSAIDLAKAHVQTADAQAKATGQTLTATQKLDAQNAALLDTAATARGPARQGILDYIGSVNQIPPEKLTEIQAAIDAGDLDTANRLLAEASAPRTAAIQADANTTAANSALNNTANPNGQPRIAEIQATVVGTSAASSILNQIRGGGARRYGGMARPGELTYAAEAGPEFIRLPGGTEGLLTSPAFIPPGTQVTSTSETAQILAALERRSDASPTSVTIHVPRGSRPDDVMRAADRYARRNGRAHASRRR